MASGITPGRPHRFTNNKAIISILDWNEYIVDYLDDSLRFDGSGNTEAQSNLDVLGDIDPTTYDTTNGGFQDDDTFAAAAPNKTASSESIKAYIDTALLEYVPKQFFGYDPDGDTIVDAPGVDLPIKTEVVKDSEFTHTTDSAEVTVTADGTYEIIAEAAFQMDANDVVELAIYVDTGGGYAELAGALAYCNG